MDATESMDSMSDMGHSSGSMGMGFTNTQNTLLFSAAWTPSSSGAYAGTCIFLIILSIVDRGLIALKAMLERHWLDLYSHHRYVAIANKTTESGRIDDDPDAKLATLITAQGGEEPVKIVHTIRRGPIPWRLGVDLPRAALFLCIAGVSYLLYVLGPSSTKFRTFC